MRSATGSGRYLMRSLSVGGERCRLSRSWRILLATVVVLLLVLAAATARLLVWPTQGMLASVNAIVMLAGPGDRLPVALRLATDRKAPVLVVSQGHLGYGGPCPPTTTAPGTEIICFDPDP